MATQPCSLAHSPLDDALVLRHQVAHGGRRICASAQRASRRCVRLDAIADACMPAHAPAAASVTSAAPPLQFAQRRSPLKLGPSAISRSSACPVTSPDAACASTQATGAAAGGSAGAHAMQGTSARDDNAAANVRPACCRRLPAAHRRKGGHRLARGQAGDAAQGEGRHGWLLMPEAAAERLQARRWRRRRKGEGPVGGGREGGCAGPGTPPPLPATLPPSSGLLAGACWQGRSRRKRPPQRCSNPSLPRRAGIDRGVNVAHLECV